ncbi:hypothetical protein EBR96_04220 [bacterium]|nr:hypothetical protein [bacterium]
MKDDHDANNSNWKRLVQWVAFEMGCDLDGSLLKALGDEVAVRRMLENPALVGTYSGVVLSGAVDDSDQNPIEAMVTHAIDDLGRFLSCSQNQDLIGQFGADILPILARGEGEVARFRDFRDHKHPGAASGPGTTSIVSRFERLYPIRRTISNWFSDSDFKALVKAGFDRWTTKNRRVPNGRGSEDDRLINWASIHFESVRSARIEYKKHASSPLYDAGTIVSRLALGRPHLLETNELEALGLATDFSSLVSSADRLREEGYPRTNVRAAKAQQIVRFLSMGIDEGDRYSYEELKKIYKGLNAENPLMYQSPMVQICNACELVYRELGISVPNGNIGLLRESFSTSRNFDAYFTHPSQCRDTHKGGFSPVVDLPTLIQFISEVIYILKKFPGVIFPASSGRGTALPKDVYYPLHALSRILTRANQVLNQSGGEALDGLADKKCLEIAMKLLNNLIQTRVIPFEIGLTPEGNVPVTYVWAGGSEAEPVPVRVESLGSRSFRSKMARDEKQKLYSMPSRSAAGPGPVLSPRGGAIQSPRPVVLIRREIPEWLHPKSVARTPTFNQTGTPSSRGRGSAPSRR